MNRKKMRVLKIDDLWLNLILNGSKTWELRRQNTKIREKIALGNLKKKCIVGYATIVDSFEITIEELKKHNDRHRANDFLDTYGQGRKSLFVWVLANVEVEQHPKPYSFSTGSWCKAILDENSKNEN